MCIVEIVCKGVHISLTTSAIERVFTTQKLANASISMEVNLEAVGEEGGSLR